MVDEKCTVAFYIHHRCISQASLVERHINSAEAALRKTGNVLAHTTGKSGKPLASAPVGCECGSGAKSVVRGPVSSVGFGLRLILSSGPVLVFYGCCNKSPQTWVA